MRKRKGGDRDTKEGNRRGTSCYFGVEQPQRAEPSKVEKGMLRSGSAPALPTETTSIDRATSASRLRIGAGRAATHQQAHLEGGVGPSPCEAYAALIEETFDDLLDEVDLTEEWKLIKEELGVKVSKKTLAENGSVLPSSSSPFFPETRELVGMNGPAAANWAAALRLQLLPSFFFLLLLAYTPSPSFVFLTGRHVSQVNCMRGDADLQCSAQEFRQLVLQAGSFFSPLLLLSASPRPRTIEGVRCCEL